MINFDCVFPTVTPEESLWTDLLKCPPVSYKPFFAVLMSIMYSHIWEGFYKRRWIDLLALVATHAVQVPDQDTAGILTSLVYNEDNFYNSTYEESPNGNMELVFALLDAVRLQRHYSEIARIVVGTEAPIAENIPCLEKPNWIEYSIIKVIFMQRSQAVWFSAVLNHCNRTCLPHKREYFARLAKTFTVNTKDPSIENRISFIANLAADIIKSEKMDEANELKGMIPPVILERAMNLQGLDECGKDFYSRKMFSTAASSQGVREFLRGICCLL